MTAATTTMVAPTCTALESEKRLATLRAQAALAGAELVAIEGDDGGMEILLTHGAATLRFHDLQAARARVWLAKARD